MPLIPATSKDLGKTPMFTMHAPPLAAPSKQDIINQLEFFFGKPAAPEKLVNFTDHHAVTGHFPDAFEGSNVHLRETLSNLILKSPQTWQTSIGLPYLQIEGVVVTWDEIHFDVRLMQRVPYEGASRMQTSHRKSHRDRIVRRGVALMVESDFYRTEEGKKYFAKQIMSIQYCVQETANFDVLYAYLACHNYDWHFDLTRHLLPQHYLLGQMKRDIEPFSVIQKEKSGRGFDLCIEKAKARMARYGVRPNILIVPPEMQLYCQMVPEAKVVYAEGGERAVSRFESYDGRLDTPVGTIRGLDVHVSNPFEDNEVGRPNQMLRRQTQIGEFYVMAPPQVLSTDPLPPSYMNILIYDERRDQLANLTFREALLHAMPWKVSGDKDVNDQNFNVKKQAAVQAGNITASIQKLTATDPSLLMSRYAGVVSDEQKKVNAALKLGSGESAKPLDTNTILQFLQNNFDSTNPEHWLVLVVLAELGIWIPIQVAVTRPFIEHHMLSAIMTVAGSDTGVTLFGPSDMQIAANVAVKTIEGHYTLHSKAVITKPQNVMVLRDIQADGYVAGADMTFFGDVRHSYTAGGEPMTWDYLLNGSVGDSAQRTNQFAQSIRDDIRDRLDFEHDVDNRYPSILCFCVPLEDGSKPSQRWKQDHAFSLVNGHTPWDVGPDVGATTFPGGKYYFDKYTELYDLGQVTQGIDPNAMQGHSFIRTGTSNNSILLQGPYRTYSPFTRSHFDLVPGQGHFGSDALPGDARWRRGEAIDVDNARSGQVGVEALVESSKAMHRMHAAQ